MEKFSIVIPVYNEGRNLGILIPKIYKELKKEKFELIIVDDNSTDNTSEILKKFKKKNFFLKYLEFELSSLIEDEELSKFLLNFVFPSKLDTPIFNKLTFSSLNLEFKILNTSGFGSNP